MAYEAVNHHDFNLLFILPTTSAMVIVINLLIDLLYAWFDPRLVMR